jgi:hypothetical protein
MPHFLLVCGEPSRPVAVAIMEAPSMLQAHTNGVAQGLARPEPLGEIHELGAKMMKSVPPAQIGRMISGAEAARVIARLVEGRGEPEEMIGRFPRPWRIAEHPATFTVQDARGQYVAWFHFRNDPEIAQAAAVRFKEDARRRAMNFVGIPEAQGGAEKVPARADLSHARTPPTSRQ